MRGRGGGRVWSYPRPASTRSSSNMDIGKKLWAPRKRRVVSSPAEAGLATVSSADYALCILRTVAIKSLWLAYRLMSSRPSTQATSPASSPAFSLKAAVAAPVSS